MATERRVADGAHASRRAAADRAERAEPRGGRGKRARVPPGAHACAEYTRAHRFHFGRAWRIHGSGAGSTSYVLRAKTEPDGTPLHRLKPKLPPYVCNAAGWVPRGPTTVLADGSAGVHFECFPANPTAPRLHLSTALATVSLGLCGVCRGQGPGPLAPRASPPPPPGGGGGGGALQCDVLTVDAYGLSA